VSVTEERNTMYCDLDELTKLEMIRGLHTLRRSLLLVPHKVSADRKAKKDSKKMPTFSDPEKQKIFDSMPDECKALFLR